MGVVVWRRLLTFESRQMEKYKLEKVPATVFYIPDFVTEQEEEMLMRNVYAAPKPKWTQLSNRRLQNWGGLPHPKGMIMEPLPEWLQRMCTRIYDCGAFGDCSRKPNHVLVNEYLPGQGIMSATSLDARRFASVLLQRRSLVVVRDDMYTTYLHGIREATTDVVDDSFANLDSCSELSLGSCLDRTKPRISLTIRVVPKVLQNKILFGKK